GRTRCSKPSSRRRRRGCEASGSRMPTGKSPNAPIGPATPHGHRSSSADWDYPFPLPGRWAGKRKLAASTERRQPWGDGDAGDPTRIAPRYVRAPVSLAEFTARMRAIADDAGVISVDHPAIAHELDEIRYVYPHARSLVVLIGEENKPSMQSRYLP